MLARKFRLGGRNGLSLVRKIHVDKFDGTGITVSGIRSAPGPITFRNVFLRDACPSHVDRSTHQKDFSTGQLDNAVKAVEASAEGRELSVKWSDGQVSRYPEDLLSRYVNYTSRRKFRRLDKSRTEIWKNKKVGEIHTVDYAEYMGNEKALARALRELQRAGLIFVKNVPRPEDQAIPVEDIARRIGYIKETFYGTSWDVTSVPDAKNIAYTSVYLPLHMDLLYYESPPGIQLLHIIENKATGGESVFADSFAAAKHVLDVDPEAYDALTSIPLSFHYLHETEHYYFQRPLVVEDPYSAVDPATGRKEISVVNYAPPFQGPLDALATDVDASAEQLDALMRGLKLFEAFIESPDKQLETRMDENTCMLFFNRRVLHGRREFDQMSGRRHFRGTYLDIDAFNSKLRVTDPLLEPLE
ncbi:hypothetical protein TRVA0_006S03576 [Trichomonascus vanleenenianus]|uniref:Aim17p n=1 Tax=Trichomonascus vanleenenianus TaxID=2268995 RepID=UPI003ECA5611